jgi:hypothetical protein
MWEKALEIASRVTHPTAAAVFAIVIAAIVIRFLGRPKKPSIAWLLAAGIIALGLAPTVASAILQHQGIYHIRIVVLNEAKQPVDDAAVISSAGGELKKASYNWEFDLAPQARPSDSKVRFFASVRDSFSAGSSILSLSSDFFPEVTIQLEPLPAATIRGVVEDESGRSVPGAKVAVAGYRDIATTDSLGNFALPAHAADGEMVNIRAEKGDLVAEDLVPAGKTTVLVVRKR